MHAGLCLPTGICDNAPAQVFNVFLMCFICISFVTIYILCHELCTVSLSLHTHTHTHMQTHINMYMHTHTHAHTCTHTHMYIHAHTHIYIYMHTHKDTYCVTNCVYELQGGAMPPMASDLMSEEVTGTFLCVRNVFLMCPTHSREARCHQWPAASCRRRSQARFSCRAA